MWAASYERVQQVPTAPRSPITSAEAAPAAAEPTSAPEATAAGEGATAAEEKPE
jgi:hypothetical protein